MTIQLGKKQISDRKDKTIIVVAVLVFLGFLVLGVMLGGTDSTESNQKVAYRVCEKYSGTRCDILDPKDWRKLSNGFSVRGPRFENIHDPRNVRQYPDWFLVEKININAYK